MNTRICASSQVSQLPSVSNVPFAKVALLSMALMLSACVGLPMDDTGPAPVVVIPSSPTGPVYSAGAASPGVNPVADAPLAAPVEARALYEEAVGHFQQGRSREAIAASDKIVFQFGTGDTASTRKLVAQALILKSRALGSTVEIVAVYDEIDRRFGATLDPGAREQLVTTMFDRAAQVAHANDKITAIGIYDRIEKRYPEDSRAAWAVFYQGEIYRERRDVNNAILSYERLEQRYAHSNDASVRQAVADGLSANAELLGEKGDAHGAITVFDEIARLYSTDRDPAFRLRALRALFKKAAVLGKYNSDTKKTDYAAAIATYDDIVRRFGDDRDVRIHNAVGGTLLKKSEALRATGDQNGMIAIYDDIIRRFSADTAAVSRTLTANVLYRKGQALGREGKNAAAAALYDQVARDYGSDTTADIQNVVRQAAAARNALPH